MNLSGPDVVAFVLCLALAAPIMFPVFKEECLDEHAAGIYENVVMATIAVVAAYIGARVAGKNPPQ